MIAAAPYRRVRFALCLPGLSILILLGISCGSGAKPPEEAAAVAAPKPAIPPAPATTSPAPVAAPAAGEKPAGAKAAAPAETLLPTSVAPASAPGGKATSAAAPASEEVVVLETTKGKLTIALNQQDCPKHTESFKKLVRQGFFDGLPFFRVFKDGYAQAGSEPNEAACSTAIPAEIKHKHVRGAVGAAHFQNPGTESLPCQFYICTGPLPDLDEDYTVFGNVIEGLEAVDRFQAGNRSKENNGRVSPLIADRILKATVTAR